jgi:CxxC-x17-CxxC domain-containing protein
MMNYADRTLTCVECGQPFIFSADDQAYHAEKGYTSEPRRCPACRQARRSQRGNDSFGGGYDRGPREMHPAVCAECGKDTEVPFRPRGDRPVYCNDCFRQRRRPATSRRF